MAICIAGMHRSGTSLVAQLLNLCGLYLGAKQDLIQSTEDNPEGYWEHARLVDLNDTILSLFRGGWDLPPHLPQGWISHPALETVKKEVERIFHELSKGGHWGWKDPRNSLTIDFWKSQIPDLCVIICVRNPREVAKSLYQRAWCSDIFAFNLWKRYNQTLLDSLQPKQYIVTHYESYFLDPLAELRRVANFARLDATEDRLNEATATIKTALWRNRASIDKLPPDIARLYDQLESKAGDVFRRIRPSLGHLPNPGGGSRKDARAAPVKAILDLQTHASCSIDDGAGAQRDIEKLVQAAIAANAKDHRREIGPSENLSPTGTRPITTPKKSNAINGEYANLCEVPYQNYRPDFNTSEELPILELADYYYYHMNDLQRALPLYLRTIELGKRDIDTLLSIASIYAESGNMQGAQRYLKMVHTVDPLSIWPGWYQEVVREPKWFRDRLQMAMELVNSTAENAYSFLAQFDDHFWFWLHTMGCRKYSQLRWYLPELPDSEIQVNLTGSAGDQSMWHGFMQYLLFRQIITKHLEPNPAPHRILDFGCGYGRILRFFIKDYPTAELHGVDIQESFVKWCNANIRYGAFARCNTSPPSSYPSGMFDVIYSFSVFSHLNPENGQAWLKELKRVCSRNGLVIVTIWSHPSRTKDYHASHFPDYDRLIREYESGKFCFSALKYPKDSVYAEALIPRSYILEVWSRFFTILDIIEGHRFSSNQSYVVMQNA